MEVPRLGTEPETQLWPVPQVWQCWILNLLHHKGTSYQDFSDEIGGDINECDFKKLFYNEMCWYLEDQHNSVNQYFLKTNSLYYKTMHEWKVQSNFKVDQSVFMCETVIDMVQTPHCD